MTKKDGDTVISQGEDGDLLYIVESGTLTCTRVNSDSPDPVFLKEYQQGEVFGELALLYNAPRAATIVAKGDAELWALDRKTFGAIVRDSAQRKRDKYEEFLKRVEILKSMASYERSTLADVL